MEVSGGGLLAFGPLTLFFGALTVRHIRRLATAARTQRRGVRPAGTCVRVASEPRDRSDARRHFSAFQDASGHTVEFEDPASRSVTEGTAVTVACGPRGRRRTATIAGRGAGSPAARYVALVAGCRPGTAGSGTPSLVQIRQGA